MKKGGTTIFWSTLSVLMLSLFYYLIPPTQLTDKQKNTSVLGQTVSTSNVIKVIDGDTIEVASGSSRQKVRIIGINTPETVDPRKTVECFGKEASLKAKELLHNQQVRLESDPSQAAIDRYGRALRYVILSDGSDFGLKMITEGYAYEYTYDKPYKYQDNYKKAQNEAQQSRRGLWGDSCQNNTADK